MTDMSAMTVVEDIIPRSRLEGLRRRYRKKVEQEKERKLSEMKEADPERFGYRTAFPLIELSSTSSTHLMKARKEKRRITSNDSSLPSIVGGREFDGNSERLLNSSQAEARPLEHRNLPHESRIIVPVKRNPLTGVILTPVAQPNERDLKRRKSEKKIQAINYVGDTGWEEAQAKFSSGERKRRVQDEKFRRLEEEKARRKEEDREARRLNMERQKAAEAEALAIKEREKIEKRKKREQRELRRREKEELKAKRKSEIFEKIQREKQEREERRRLSADQDDQCSDEENINDNVDNIYYNKGNQRDEDELEENRRKTLLFLEQQEENLQTLITTEQREMDELKKAKESKVKRKREKVATIPTESSPVTPQKLPQEFLEIQQESIIDNIEREPTSNGDEYEAIKVAPCKVCQRNFAIDRLQRHQNVCKKAASATRKVFDPAKQRAEGTELADFKPGRVDKKKEVAIKKAEEKKNNWKKKHDDFINTIRYAKKATQVEANGGDISNLPPPISQADDDLSRCPHCNRTFHSDAAERHIPKCKDRSSKVKPSTTKKTRNF